MKHYPLNVKSSNRRFLDPQDTTFSEEYIKEHCDLYLAEELTSDQYRNVYRHYRLHAAKPHSIDMALAYDITCPKCRTHLLKQVGRCLNSYDLGLYKCPVCDKD